MSAAISVQGVSKKFRWHRDKRSSFKERVFRGKPEQLNEFWALKDISFDIERGTTFGLVGHNGSGKSTLLKLLAGIHRPTRGTVITDGRISALLELGAGFHPELTGRENIYLNGAILGLSRKQIDTAMDKIIDFSGIEDFVDVPVKVYSSGMYVRLGFSIAVTIDPEILLVDEIVAVGDEEFQRKCFDHLHELHKRGTTIVIVSHALGVIENLCERAVWLDHGDLRVVDEARKVVRQYLAAVNEEEASHALTTTDNSNGPTRLGSGDARITRVEYLDAHGTVTPVLVAGEPATFRMHYKATRPVVDPVFGIGFFSESGVNVAGPNSAASGQLAEVIDGEGYVDFQVSALTLQPGVFDVSASIVHKGHVYDHAERAWELRVRGADSGEPGLVRMTGDWSAATDVPDVSPAAGVRGA